MRVIPLHRDSDSDYSCTVYWILGDNNEARDRNTLIDSGSSNVSNLGYFMREMAAQSKGIGKMAIEQVILTHNHYDHSGGLAGIVRQFDPILYSWLAVPGRHERTTDGMHVTVGNHDAIIIHTPGHSDDSICVWLPDLGTLFSGDTIFRITDDQGTYSRLYRESLEKLSALSVSAIYPGHGHPVTSGATEYILSCLDHVKRSIVAD